MTTLYLALTPIFFITLFKRIKEFSSAIKEKNRDRIKIEILFLSLTIGVSILTIISIESTKR